MIKYFSRSKSATYSLVFTLPLFLIYEFGLMSLGQEQVPLLRNGADVLLRRMLEVIGLNGLQAFGFVMLVALVMILVGQIRKEATFSMKSSVLFAMGVESIFWSLGLYFGMAFLERSLLTHTVSGWMHQVVLAVGAGIYEELVFRAALVTGLSYLLVFFFRWRRSTSLAGAIFLSSLIFSVFHFLGSAADQYSFNLLLFRLSGGIYLGILYVTRGYGITAWSHSIYDLIVLLTITV
ncbi:MAG: type II CAAX prenyl endopeptidase Rce1 family protein [Fidelibacterota bacterium]